MIVDRVDPRDCQWESYNPAYRVYFWEHPAHASDEWRVTDVNSVHEVLAWAHSKAGSHQTFQLWVEATNEQGLGLILLLGGPDPTEHQAGTAELDTRTDLERA